MHSSIVRGMDGYIKGAVIALLSRHGQICFQLFSAPPNTTPFIRLPGVHNDTVQYNPHCHNIVDWPCHPYTFTRARTCCSRFRDCVPRRPLASCRLYFTVSTCQHHERNSFMSAINLLSLTCVLGPYPRPMSLDFETLDPRPYEAAFIGAILAQAHFKTVGMSFHSALLKLNTNFL